MKFLSTLIFIVSKSTICVNFMLLLLSIDLFFLTKVSPRECRFLPRFGPEILPMCFRFLVWFISIIEMDFNIYLSKHSWNTHFCSPNTHQDGKPQQVSYASYMYCSCWALIFKVAAKICSIILGRRRNVLYLINLIYYNCFCTVLLF